MKIVTYATHPEGSFNDLINNKFGVEVTVLGMGEKGPSKSTCHF
jgi:hypothetical protein